MDETHDNEPTEEEWDNMTFDELFERSSFGSPESVALREQCPPEVRDELMARLRAYYENNP